MACYACKTKPPSKSEFKHWQSIGYTGTYQQYSAAKNYTGEAQMFICGDLGEHCADCAGVAEFLCDYPVGDGKTCDRKICHSHAKEVSPEIHYCEQHYNEWVNFKNSGGIAEHLKNIIAFKDEK